MTLVKPDVERDAPISVTWLRGREGRETLRLMGIAPEYIIAPDIEIERERLQAVLKYLQDQRHERVYSRILLLMKLQTIY